MFLPFVKNQTIFVQKRTLRIGDDYSFVLTNFKKAKYVYENSSRPRD